MPYGPSESPEITVTVTAAVIATAIQNWTISPTSGPAGSKFHFSGKLVRSDTGAGLGGMQVWLVVNGVEATTYMTTASDGTFGGDWIPAAEGTYKLKARFKGA